MRVSGQQLENVTEKAYECDLIQFDRYEIGTWRKVIQRRRKSQEIRFSTERRGKLIRLAARTAAVRMAQATAK